MDATRRPLKIPPEFGFYADKHGIFDLYKRILSELIVSQPADPLSFISQYLEREDDNVPQIMIVGPPESGKTTISKMVCRALGTVLVTADSVWNDSDVKKEMTVLGVGDIEEREKLNVKDWGQLVKKRLTKPDALKNGWVMVSMPETRNQQKVFTELGIFPKHCVILDAPDSVLMDRIEGKRVDPVTGDTYHVTYDWPMSKKVANRLVALPSLDVDGVVKRLVEHRRNMDAVLPQYKHTSIVIDADQPKADVYSNVMTYLCQAESTCAPRTPRIILIGPPGSGRHTAIVHDIIKRYGFVNVDIEQMIKEAIAGETVLGIQCKAARDANQPVSDELLLEMLKTILSRKDCATRGWILVGYPLNSDQAQQLTTAGYIPNRVIILDVSPEALMERITLRVTDPVTGSRHHLRTNPPRTPEASNRMQVHPEDTENKLAEKVKAYKARIKEVEEFYKDVVHHVNADQEQYNVTQTIEGIIVGPAPKCCV